MDLFGENRVPGAREMGVKALLGLAMTAALLIADPLEIGSRTERHSRDVFNAIFGAPAATTPSVEEIAVVVLNESTLRALGMPWPLPYAVHADIIDAIRGYAPKAVVVDVLFVDPARRDPSISELADTLRAEGRAKTFLAAVPSQGPGGAGILPDLDPSGWRDAPGRAELVAVDDVPPDFAHSPYGLLRATGPDSPAFAVYRHLCAVSLLAGCRDAPEREDFRQKMEIQWPVGAPDPFRQERLIDTTCTTGPNGRLARLWAVVGAAGGLDDLRQTCPPFTAVLAQQVLRPGGREEALDRALRGKVVFYGVSVTGNADAVRVGHMRDALPGVFVHAAAFENLARWGARYRTDTPRSGYATETMIEMLMAIAMAVFVFVGTRHAQIAVANAAGAIGGTPFLRRMGIVWPRCALWWAVGAAVAGGVIFLEYEVLAVAPSNWIALLTMSTATLAMMEPAIKSG